MQKVLTSAEMELTVGPPCPPPTSRSGVEFTKWLNANPDLSELYSDENAFGEQNRRRLFVETSRYPVCQTAFDFSHAALMRGGVLITPFAQIATEAQPTPAAPKRKPHCVELPDDDSAAIKRYMAMPSGEVKALWKHSPAFRARVQYLIDAGLI